MMAHKEIVMIGCGNMGQAILLRLACGRLADYQFHVVKPSEPNNELRRKNINFVNQIDELPSDIAPYMVILAVKPQIMKEVLSQIKKRFSEDVLFLTMAAGLKMAFYEQNLGEQAKIIRIMPNTAVNVGKGVVGVALNYNVSLLEKHWVSDNLLQLGELVFLPNDAMIDAITAVSGSGIAYGYYFMEQLIDAAVKVGFSAEQARNIVAQTLAGAAEMAISHSDLSLVKLREMVTSKGGTTEAALQQLQKNDDFAKIIFAAVQAAMLRSEQLSSANTTL
jgi:pyrroline-5-carboxylate reductase